MIYDAAQIKSGLKRITLRQLVLVVIVVAVPGGIALSMVVAKLWTV